MGKLKIRVTDWHKKFIVEERYVTPQVRRRLYVAAIALMVVGAALFTTFIYQVVNNTGIVQQDHQVATWFVQHRASDITPFMMSLAIAFGPVVLPIVLALFIAVWIITAKHIWRPALLGGFMILGVIAVQIIAHMVGRERPPVELMLLGADHTFSFPSGHVMGTADFLLIASYLIASRKPTRRRIVIGSVVVLVGIALQIISRLYLGYHWMSDTLTSVSLALFVLGLVILVDTWRTVRIPGEKIEGEFSEPQVAKT